MMADYEVHPQIPSFGFWGVDHTKDLTAMAVAVTGGISHDPWSLVRSDRRASAHIHYYSLRR